MTQQFTVEGLKELISSMEKYPAELDKVVNVSMSASLTALHEKVPPYPRQNPQANYRRTGTLGRSLGSGEQGGASGQPSVYVVRKFGQGNYEGVFGTNLDYAPYVIGDNTQAGMHSSNWWTIKQVAERAADKIEKVWDKCGELLAQFLEGKK